MLFAAMKELYEGRFVLISFMNAVKNGKFALAADLRACSSDLPVVCEEATAAKRPETKTGKRNKSIMPVR